MDEEAVADIFAAFGPVKCRRMFGGIGVYVDGMMFALVAFDRLYLKADAVFASDLEGQGCERFVYEARGRGVGLPYWTMPEAALDDADAAATLARRALSVARASAETKPRRKAVRTRKNSADA